MAGRPSFIPTDQQRLTVQISSACGMPQELIAQNIGIDPKTLRRAFREELDSGMEAANAMVAQSLFKKATGTGQGAVTAAIFWLKARAGWKETQAVEMTGKDGGPITTKGERDLTDEELAAELARHGIKP